MEINPQDLRIDMLPSPKGGMVTSPSNGIEITHLPTGIVVRCDSERSQHKNRDIAIKELRKQLEAFKPPEIETSDEDISTIASAYVGYKVDVERMPLLEKKRWDEVFKAATGASLKSE